MIRPWLKKTSKIVSRYSVFDLRRDVLLSPRNGSELTAYVLETRDWVNIVPLTPDREVIMVRQYRFAAEEITLEIPGGLIDRADLSPAEAARREMREETGYDSDRIVELGCCRPNPAILNNLCHIYLAENVELKYGQKLDIGEDILVESIPLDRIPSLIREGIVRHSLVLNAFYLLDLYWNS